MQGSGLVISVDFRSIVMLCFEAYGTMYLLVLSTSTSYTGERT